MKFAPEELEICSAMFSKKKTTSEVQEYLMEKYDTKRSSTSNFVKLVRKRLGIYHPKSKNKQLPR